MEVSFEIDFRGRVAVPYSGEGRAGLRLPLIALGDASSETISQSAVPAGDTLGFRLFDAQGLTIGCAVQPVAGTLEGATLNLYSRLLRATAGKSLYRIWNYVPDINRVSGGVEHYQAFSSGRARAFEVALGAEYRRSLPAASAVGCRGRSIGLVFVAGKAAARYCENPEQIPAYEYPSEHGPHSPSFARATVARHKGEPLVYISGTSAIKGHETLYPGSTLAQLECTLDNLQLISRAAGVGDNLGAALGLGRRFKVYLRHGADLRKVQARLEACLFRSGDRVVWVQTDLCRAGLNVEIEASLRGEPSAGGSRPCPAR
jgi:hypothetical protein